MEQTDSEMQAQYEARHENLLHSMSDMKDSISHAFHKITPETHRDPYDYKTITSEDDDIYGVGGFEARTTKITTTDTNWLESNNAKMGTQNSSTETSRIEDTAHSDMIGHGLNQIAMDAISRDIAAMGQMDPEVFETVAAKVDDTFGCNALTDDGGRLL